MPEMTRLPGKRLRALATAGLSLALCACGGGGGGSDTPISAQQPIASTQTLVQGNAVKGVIIDGLVRAYRLTDEPGGRVRVAQSRTDQHGEFNLNLPAGSAGQLILLELSADARTRMRCDLLDGCFRNREGRRVEFGDTFSLNSNFTLRGTLSPREPSSQEKPSSPRESSSSFISPLSHLAIATAESLPGGLSRATIQTAAQQIENSLGLNQPLLATRTADLTELSTLRQASVDEIQQGLYSAVFYEYVERGEWINNRIALNSLPITDILEKSLHQAELLEDRQLTSRSDTGHLSQARANIEAQRDLIAMGNLIIHDQPATRTLDEGAALNLSVIATGDQGLRYQWYKDGRAIAGANSATLNIVAATTRDSGNYRVKVTDDDQSLRSDPAIVKVRELALPVRIIDTPQPANVNSGDTVNLNVRAEGDGRLSYQWQKDGSIIAGADTARLTLLNSQPADSGRYSVTVSNGAGHVVSNVVNVFITTTTPPVKIRRQPSMQTVVEGKTAQFTVQASGGGTLKYRWRRNGTWLNHSYGPTLRIHNATVRDTGEYDVVISNSVSRVVSKSVSLFVMPYAQFIRTTAKKRYGVY